MAARRDYTFGIKPHNTNTKQIGAGTRHRRRHSSCCGCHRSKAIRAYDRYLRWLYRGGRPSRFARLQNRLSAILFAVGILPNRAARLEIRGRRSGRVISFPVAIADFEGGRYLVSMLGRNANWVLNLRAAGGRAVLRHGRREKVHLEEIAPASRAPILRRYLQVAPGARAHIPVDRNAPRGDFERIAPDYPVFRIRSDLP
jgi:deazaflavin-dependent oxidoreductase (nitroreductase family)